MRLSALVMALCVQLCAASEVNAYIIEPVDIPPEPLGVALNQLAKDRGFQIIYVSEELSGIRCAGAQGNLTPAQALNTLLNGTGFTFRYLNDRTVTIVPTSSSDGQPSEASSSASAAEQPQGTESNSSGSFPFRVAQVDQGANPGVPPVAASAAIAASRDEQLQEVVVTAERRAADVQKTAASVSVRNGAQLQDQGKYNLAQILEDVAAVQAAAPAGTPSDTPGSGVTIRGIQSNAGYSLGGPGVASTTAIYVDGVYNGIGGNYDIDRVEILRGPQGTLYGRSATSGLVATHTVDPQLSRWGGDAAVEIGNDALQHYTAALNAPLLGDVLALRVSGNSYQRNGYSRGFSSAQGGATENTDGRAKLLFKPNDDFSLLLGAALENNNTRSGGVGIQQPTPNHYAFVDSPVGRGGNSYRQYWALLNWNLGFATLVYQPAYREWDESLASYVVSSIHLTSSGSTPYDNFHTQELRLTSNPGSLVTWQIGGMYYHNDAATSSVVYITYPPPLVGLASDEDVHEKTVTNSGVFAEATYPFAPWWRVTGGVRYDDSKVTVNESYTSLNLQTLSLADARHFSNFTYKARLEHDVTAQNMLYASISTGFSPGDVSAANNAQNAPIVLTLKAETLTAYEIGSKNRFLNNSLQINGDVYFYHYGAFQTNGVNCTPQAFAPTACTLSSPAQVFGGELENLWQVTPHDRFGLDLAFTNAYWVTKNNLNAGIGLPFSYFFGSNQLPGVVPFTANLSYDHGIPLPGGSIITLHGDVRYQSPHDTTNLELPWLQAGLYPDLRASGQTVGDLSIGWVSSDGHYSVNGYVRNVGNNEYKTGGVPFTNIAGGGYTVNANLSDPRTYGIILSAHF